MIGLQRNGNTRLSWHLCLVSIMLTGDELEWVFGHICSFCISFVLIAGCSIVSYLTWQSRQQSFSSHQWVQLQTRTCQTAFVRSVAPGNKQFIPQRSSFAISLPLIAFSSLFSYFRELNVYAFSDTFVTWIIFVPPLDGRSDFFYVLLMVLRIILPPIFVRDSLSAVELLAYTVYQLIDIYKQKQ